jgi:hypothetical protein
MVHATSSPQDKSEGATERFTEFLLNTRFPQMRQLPGYSGARLYLITYKSSLESFERKLPADTEYSKHLMIVFFEGESIPIIKLLAVETAEEVVDYQPHLFEAGFWERKRIYDNGLAGP